MKYEIQRTSQFKKDYKKAKLSKHNFDELKSVIEKLANDIPLEAKYHDHALKGNYVKYRECHVESDWLLVYKKHKNKLVLLLYRLGTHSELF